MNINDLTRKELLDESEGLSDEQLNRKPSDAEWSIKQILEHLYLMEGMIAKTIAHQLKAGDVTTVPDKPIERTVDRSVKVQAPTFVNPSDDFAPLTELKDKLAQSHAALQHVAEQADEAELRARSFTHPVFGEVNLYQWIPFAAYHEKRHIEQLRDVKRKLGYM